MPERIGKGRRVLRRIARGGGVLCAVAAVVGIVLVAVADRAPGPPIEQTTGVIGAALFIFGLVAPFGFWSVHLAVEQWVDEAGEFYPGEHGRPVTVAASTAFGFLGLGLFTFALSPAVAMGIDDGDDTLLKLVVVMVGSICLSIAVAAVAGGIALFGWPGALVGALVGTGFTTLVVGLVVADARFLVPVGAVLLVLGTAGFWLLRARAWGEGRDV